MSKQYLILYDIYLDKRKDPHIIRQGDYNTHDELASSWVITSKSSDKHAYCCHPYNGEERFYVFDFCDITSYTSTSLFAYMMQYAPNATKFWEDDDIAFLYLTDSRLPKYDHEYESLDYYEDNDPMTIGGSIVYSELYIDPV